VSKIEKSDFKKSQTVYIASVNPNMVIEVTVKSIGVNYLTVDYREYLNNIQFDIKNEFHQVCKYAYEWKLYLHKEDIESNYVTENEKIINDIKPFFNFNENSANLSYNQLIRIREIIYENIDISIQQKDTNLFQWNDTISKLYDNDE
jgi:hypothetical protein